MKQSGKCILPIPSKEEQQNTFPSDFNKRHLVNLQLAVPFDELAGRLGSSSSAKLSTIKLKQFLQIVIQYLDFKQKEKFNKLKKLRRNQSNLPVAKYRSEIVEAVKNGKVVLLAGDTGCGKSTQIPQFLHEAGFNNIGN